MTSLTFLFGIESRVLFAVMIKNQIWILNPREASDTLERSTASISSGPGYSSFKLLSSLPYYNSSALAFPQPVTHIGFWSI